MKRKDFLKSLILAPVTAKVLMEAKPLPQGITHYNPSIFERPMTPEEAFSPVKGICGRYKGTYAMEGVISDPSAVKYWQTIEDIFLNENN